MDLVTIKALLWTAIIITVYFFAKRLWEIYKLNNYESSRFAHNTIHNHARISGISKQGKLSHQKVSCGGATFCDGVLDENYTHGAHVIVGENPHGGEYTFTPQTRLHGGGWFA